MDNEVVVHLNNGILLSLYKKERIWVSSNEVDEQSEVSQKEKDKYCILMHIYDIYKDGTNDPTCRAAKETQWEKVYHRFSN